jgi:outer membrane protein
MGIGRQPETWQNLRRNRMKKIALAALLLAWLAACKTAGPEKAAGQPAPKPPKKNPVVVVVDVERIVKETKMSQDIQNELNAWGQNMQAQLQAKAEAFKQKDAEFRAEAIRLSPQQRDQRIRELEAMQQDLQQLQAQAQQEFERRQGLAGQKMSEKFEPLVRTLASENGWDVVLNKAAQNTIFANDALDQTDYVIQRLNSTGGIPGSKEPAPAPATGAPATGAQASPPEPSK